MSPVSVWMLTWSCPLWGHIWEYVWWITRIIINLRRRRTKTFFPWCICNKIVTEARALQWTLFVQCWRVCSPGSGVFAVYSLLCECGRRHVSACLHSFCSLERRLLDSSSETSCASASTLLCVEIYELSAEWKVSTTARKHPADTCSSKCSAALRSAQRTNIESFVKTLPASEPIRSKGRILVTVLCCYVHESITVFELKKTLTETKMSLCVSQRNVNADQEAVEQFARATNNLLDSLGSLTAEVRHSPETLDMMSLMLERHVLQRTVVSSSGQCVLWGTDLFSSPH